MRLNVHVREIEKREKEALVLGLLSACQACNDTSAKGKKREKSALTYHVEGRPVCRGAFLYAFDMGIKQFKNLVAHLWENINGPVPRDHGNRGKRPHNALSFPVVKACVQFIPNHADEFGLPHPAPLHG